MARQAMKDRYFETAGIKVNVRPKCLRFYHIYYSHPMNLIQSLLPPCPDYSSSFFPIASNYSAVHVDPMSLITFYAIVRLLRFTHPSAKAMLDHVPGQISHVVQEKSFSSTFNTPSQLLCVVRLILLESGADYAPIMLFIRRGCIHEEGTLDIIVLSEEQSTLCHQQGQHVPRPRVSYIPANKNDCF